MTTEPNNLATLLPPDKKSLPGVGIQECGPYTNQVGDETIAQGPPTMNNLDKSIKNLQDNWPHLHDLDRTNAIIPILDAGMSGRSLARTLDVSESLIRRLKALAAASPEERRRARLGEMSTRKLLRQIADRQAQEADKAKQAEQQVCVEAAQEGAGHTLQWFYDEKMAHPYAERIVLEARRKLFEAARDGNLPKEKAPAGLAISEIIHRCDLAVPLCTDDISFVERYANWLVLWAVYAMPDGRVRDKALDIALSKLEKGWWPDNTQRRRPPQRLATASTRRKHAPAKSAKR